MIRAADRFSSHRRGASAPGRRIVVCVAAAGVLLGTLDARAGEKELGIHIARMILAGKMPEPSAEVHQTDKSVILMVGLPGAGKTEAGRRLAEQLTRRGIEAEALSAGNISRHAATLLQQRSKRYADKSLEAVSWYVTDTILSGNPAATFASFFASSSAKVIVYDGPRRPEELPLVQQAARLLRVVGVQVGAERRHARMLDRNRYPGETIGRYRRRDAGDRKMGVPQLTREAHYRIRPREGMAALDRSIDRLARKLIKTDLGN